MSASIPVIYAADENFVHPALVAMSSLRFHSRAHLQIYLLDCGLSEEGRRKIMTWAARQRALELEVIPLHAGELASFPWQENPWYTPATFARLCVPRLLALPEALYLDADTVLLRPVEELWEEARALRAPLAAAKDYYGSFFNIMLHIDPKITARRFRLLERLGIPDEHPYFNAGVLFLRPQELLAMDWEGEVRRLGAREPLLCHLQDQTLINVAMLGRIAELDFAWNHPVLPKNVREGKWGFENLLVQEHARPAKLMHFTSPEKPWLGLSDAEETRYFFEAAARLEAEQASWVPSPSFASPL